MRRGAAATVLTAAALGLVAAPVARADPAAAVDPFVGTGARAPDIRHGGGAGATLPGAATPFGLVQLSPETLPARAAFGAGYAWADDHIRGFSPTHVSGTGCAVLGDVPVLPLARAVTRPPSPDRLPRFDHARESATPGRYDVVLDPGTPAAIRVALTATTRTGWLRVRFPRGRPATLLLDAGGSQEADDAARVRIDPRRREVIAQATGGRFCGRDDRHRVTVVARLGRAPLRWGTWQGGAAIRPGRRAAAQRRAATGGRTVPGGLPLAPPRGARAGAMLRFAPGATVEVRLGVSFVDEAGARANLAAEAPPRRTFAATARAARRAWNRALDHVRVAGGTRAQRIMLSTSLYHALLHPNVAGDADGRYPGLDGRVHRARGWTPRTTIAGWDAYRTQFPLLALLYPAHARDVLRSLLQGARQAGGCLPRWTVAGADARVMVGDPGAVLLAEGRALGVGGVDWRAALAAAVRTVGPACRAADDRAADPARDGAASVALERATADFAVGELARSLGRDDLGAPLRARAGAAWRALDLPTAPPRSTAGLVEGSAAQYAWAVPFDVAGLAAAMGGRAAALARLDALLARLDGGPATAVADIGNEPSLLAPWLYDALGRPAATQAAVRRALLTAFAPTPGGLPGNDDAGALSAWWVLGALGLYPAIPGTDVLLLGSPLFPRAELRTGDATVVIEGRGAGAGRATVRAAALGGAPWDRPWLRAGALRRAGRLRFDLQAGRRSAWGTAAAAAPPSASPGT
jgi:predicted alpha-1,2-mannosidase